MKLSARIRAALGGAWRILRHLPAAGAGRRLLFLSLLATGFCPFAAAPARAAEAITLRIFYSSDMHGHIVPGENRIGLARIAAVKKAHPGALLVDAGDFLQGTPYANLSKGKDVVRLMRMAGYSAAAVGNHEFDHGRQALAERAREAGADPQGMAFLSANIFEAGGRPLFPADMAFDMQGVKLCLFGLTTPESAVQTARENVRGLRFADPVERARATARRLKASGCELVLVLSHIGSFASQPVRSRDIAAIEGIDAVIDGHSHVLLNERVTRGSPASARAVPWSEAGEAPEGYTGAVPLLSPQAHGRYLGELTLVLDGDSHVLTGIGSRLIGPEEYGLIAPDPELSLALDALTREQDKELGLIVGFLDRSFSGGKKELRLGESDLGNLCADAMRHAYGTDTAIINGGALRAPLPQGEVTLRHVLTALPFSDALVELRLTGAELKQVLEHGFGRYPDPDGRFAQISGLTVRVDSAAAPGARVLFVGLSDGSPLDPDREYSIAVNSFMADGGDAYPVMAGKRKLRMDMTTDQALSEYIRQGLAGGRGPQAGRIFIQ
ncbi:5'-nucleotidase C-terminal domain-containing protein [Desulfovibrio sp. OttesenSCG-928-A18]|nr:5'-nucleotidase C-terminal domain-containing protein [Desulfovibrio sp. OttesenSCG-928-A18]